MTPRLSAATIVAMSGSAATAAHGSKEHRRRDDPLDLASGGCRTLVDPCRGAQLTPRTQTDGHRVACLDSAVVGGAVEVVTGHWH
jgi:hypothetical protein